MPFSSVNVEAEQTLEQLKREKKKNGGLFYTTLATGTHWQPVAGFKLQWAE
jgi:hypothetical protein